MPRIFFVFLCAFFAAAQPGSADSVDFSGDVTVGVNSFDSRNAIARVDATLTFALARIKDRPLTFEFGTFAYFLKGDRPHETYAALAFDNRWRLGVVRPAYDRVLPSAFAFAAPSIANVRAEYTRSRATTEAMRFNSVPVGVSYSDQTGDLTWAVSAHDADDGDFRSASFGLSWQEATLQFAVAAEAVWDPRDRFEGFNAKFGGRWQKDELSVGLAYLHPDANQRPDALAFDIQYAFTTNLTVATFGEITKSRSRDAYGLAATYRFRSGSDIAVSTTSAEDSGDIHLTYTRRY